MRGTGPRRPHTRARAVWRARSVPSPYSASPTRGRAPEPAGRAGPAPTGMHAGGCRRPRHRHTAHPAGVTGVAPGDPAHQGHCVPTRNLRGRRNRPRPERTCVARAAHSADRPAAGPVARRAPVRPRQTGTGHSLRGLGQTGAVRSPTRGRQVPAGREAGSRPARTRVQRSARARTRPTDPRQTGGSASRTTSGRGGRTLVESSGLKERQGGTRSGVRVTSQDGTVPGTRVRAGGLRGGHSP